MNQFEESFINYYHQVQEEENQGYQEEPKEESNFEEREDIKINLNQSEYEIKYEQKIDASNRLNRNQKRYVTYTMEYKKRIIQEVKNKNNNNNNLIILGKIKK